MSLGTSIKNLAAKLIPKFGNAEITLTRITEGVYNTATGTTTNTSASETIAGIVEEVNGKIFVGNLIEAEDKQITIAGDIAKPSMLDTFTIGTDTFTIADNGIKTIFAQNIAAAYVLHGKKS